MTEQVQMYELYAVLDDRPMILGRKENVVPLGCVVMEQECEEYVAVMVRADTLPEGTRKVWAHPAGQEFSVQCSEGFNLWL